MIIFLQITSKVSVETHIIIRANIESLVINSVFFSSKLCVVFLFAFDLLI